MESFICQFTATADKFPNNVAILYCDSHKIINNFLYKDLKIISETIRNVFKNNIEKHACVGITVPPNPVLPAVILSVHEQQCSFICLNLNTSESQILNLIQEIKLKWILNCQSNDRANSFLRKHGSLTSCITLLDDFNLELWQINNIDTNIYPDLSYIIQTSGTTGNNKIVKVFHNCIMSNIKSLRTKFEIKSNDLIYLGTPLTFDPFIIELMLALTSGACLLIIPRNTKTNNELLLKSLFPENKSLHNGVTFIQMPPSTFLRFSEKQIKKIILENSSLRILALGGENFPEKLLKCQNRSKKLRIFNLYGITEVSCWASVDELTYAQNEISLGQTLDDTIFQIRDIDGNILDSGKGELFIGSAFRYCVIDNEKVSKLDNIIYRSTGDIVCKDEKTDKIYYLGRKNSIIKRFGHRVCLSQVEKLVYEITELNSVCVWDEKNSKLILFVILQEIDKLIKNKIIDRLRIKFLHSLPASSNPDFIEIIPNIPLTNNGKVDKNCLVKIFNIKPETRSLNTTEVFQNLWSKFFGLSFFEIEQRQKLSFLDFGGNSVLAIQLISEFDSIINNSYSNRLLTILLDKDKTYFDCCTFVDNESKLFIKEDEEKRNDFEPPAKILKTMDQDTFATNTKKADLVIKWRYNLEGCVDSTPVYFNHYRLGNLIAVGSHSRIFVILNAISGKVISKIILPDAIEGSACITPCKNYAIFGCYNGFIYCIKIENCNILWKYETKSTIKCTPVCSSKNENVIVGSYDKILYCLSVKDGTLIWKNKINEGIKSNPVVHISRDTVYVATLHGSYFCLCSKTGQIFWSKKTNSCIFGSPCIFYDENMIIWPNIKGLIKCLDCDNGDELWSYESQGFIYSSLYKMKNRIIFGCHDHNIYCLECTRQNCKELFKVNIGGAISSTPCIFTLNNQEYFVVNNNNGKLYLFDFNSKLLLQSLKLPGETFSSPIVIDNSIYIGCRDNNVYCIEINQ